MANALNRGELRSLRDSGIPAVGDLHWGTHFCHFYETPEDLLAILAPFFRAGLEDNELCIWIVFDPLTQQKAVEALRAATPDGDRRIAAGDIEIIRHEAWYLNEGGRFDLQRTMERWKGKLAKARELGYTGLRLNGNEAWLTERDWQDFVHYENELNALIAGQRIIVMCTYPLQKTTGSGVFDVARTHQFALALRHGRWEVLQTPDWQHAKDERDALSEDLETRVLERTEALRISNEQLRAFAASLEAAREDERTRISRELHDELGSLLTSLRWGLEALQRKADVALPTRPAEINQDLDSMFRMTEDIVDRVRRIASDLRPRILDDLGLIDAAQWQASQFQERTGIVCHFHSAMENVDLDPAQSTAVFRILQEALTNIIRHARATQVDIVMEERKSQFIMSVTDNGIGITPEQMARASLGIWGMEERAQLAGGSIQITGRAGDGTTVLLRITRKAPLPE